MNQQQYLAHFQAQRTPTCHADGTVLQETLEIEYATDKYREEEISTVAYGGYQYPRIGGVWYESYSQDAMTISHKNVKLWKVKNLTEHFDAIHLEAWVNRPDAVSGRKATSTGGVIKKGSGDGSKSKASHILDGEGWNNPNYQTDWEVSQEIREAQSMNKLHAETSAIEVDKATRLANAIKANALTAPKVVKVKKNKKEEIKEATQSRGFKGKGQV